MNRLLFAAARGARVQVLLNPQSKWVLAVAIRCAKDMDGFQYRIHPDDAHLQYGQISTALREAALSPDGMGTSNIPYIHFNLKMGEESVWWERAFNERSLFLLILSEALAEEGL